MTPYARNLLSLVHKMKTARPRWKREPGGYIRLQSDDGETHCPLSYCGKAHNLAHYAEGGRNLGFTQNQTESLAMHSDNRGVIFKEGEQTRRILLKAAGLEETRSL